MLLFSALLGQHLLFRFRQLFPGSIQLELHLIRKALGLNPNIPGDTDELLGKALTIKVSVRTKDGKDYQNINSYKPIGAAGASMVQPGQAPIPPQAAPQPSSQMPW